MLFAWPWTKTRQRLEEVKAHEAKADDLKRELAGLRQKLLDEALKGAKGQGDDR